jgi:curved DNA-binding protein CbpA
MKTPAFVDYYEVLECSPNASLATIERLFRHLAKELHPDASENADPKKFAEVVEIFQTLKDPGKRAAYDRKYRQHKEAPESASQSESAGQRKSSSMNDTEERTKILTALYNRRRNNMKHPGLSQGTLAEQTQCVDSVIEFHLWYFMQKGWVMREESGVLSITALGIDRIDEINLAASQESHLRIQAFG